MPLVRVRASCPTCDEVEITGPEITVFSSVEASRNVYAFECPTCFAPIVKAAGGLVVLLMRAGAQVGAWPPTTEPAPVTEYEPFDFHQRLARLPTAER